jgi:hypothetical protein
MLEYVSWGHKVQLVLLFSKLKDLTPPSPGGGGGGVQVELGGTLVWGTGG